MANCRANFMGGLSAVDWRRASVQRERWNPVALLLLTRFAARPATGLAVPPTPRATSTAILRARAQR